MGPADVAVWMARLDDAWGAACTEEEAAHAATFGSADAGRRWLAARGAVRTVLGTATGLAPAAVRFGTTTAGKPYLVDEAGIQFNASHAAGVVAIAVGAEPVGIDIEGLRRLVAPERLAARVLEPHEIGAWRDTVGDERTRRLLQAWTRVEAVLKATGTGLAGGSRGAVARLRREGWEVRDLEIAPLVGAVATRAGSWTVRGPHWLQAQCEV